MSCPFCNSRNYFPFTIIRDLLGLQQQSVYKKCLDCNMQTGYYQSMEELQRVENRNPMKRAQW